MNPIQKLAEVLGVDASLLSNLAAQMKAATGKSFVMEKVMAEMQERIRQTYVILKVSGTSQEEVQNVLIAAIGTQEQILRAYIGSSVEGTDEFDKAAKLARRIANVGKGIFLKKEKGKEILEKCPPENVVKFLNCQSVGEMLEKHEVTEIFSALRFMETDEWMHETFDAAYGAFTKDDFEERDIEIRVLPEVWQPVAEKFIAKKHHNVSHLKEFGVIFLNPVRENGQGKFLRDFALIFHYFHEIDFYSSMFRSYLPQENFGEHFKMLLRGDVQKRMSVEKGEWLIVQQYLAKIDPKDPRLFLPRINPESVHWLRAERDLANFAIEQPQIQFGMWRGMDWDAEIFHSGMGPVSFAASPTDAVPVPPPAERNPLVSFDIEDAAMTTASRGDGKPDSFFYHQREALWTHLFIEYAGGEDAMQKLLVENFDKGSIKF